MGQKARYGIGIDEVGRGALAGPVVVAAVALPRGAAGAALVRAANLGALKDSKKLSPARRTQWAHYFRRHASVAFAIARVYPRGIERLNISAAANRAALRAHARLVREYPACRTAPVILDGGLFLGSRDRQKIQQKQAKTVIKGDERVPAVAAASIIAKVARDRFMERLAVRYPEYGFAVHKGYGTAAHRAAIRRHGSCEAHRLTFLKKKPIIKR